MTDTRPEPETPLRCLVPNLVTIIGLGAGLTSLRFVYSGTFELAAALIVVAALFDWLDGVLARRLNATSAFGAELDSLSDFLCFGVAPAFLVYRFALAEAASIAWTSALVFAICCCLRLARFNASRGRPAPGRAHFVGVPAPAGALLAMLPVFLSFAGLIEAHEAPAAVAAWLCIVGMLMVSRLRTFSPKALRVPRDKAPWVAAVSAVVVATGVIAFWRLMVLVDALYLASLLYAAAGAASRRARPRAARGDVRGD